jgi:serine/threonine protein kinase/tetratricopeptide (TPR) repeat protein
MPRPTDSLTLRKQPRPLHPSALEETDDCAPNTMRVAVQIQPPAAPVLDPLPSEDGEPGVPELLVGQRVHGFQLIEQLGKGAFAQVFLAEQEAVAGRRVVLKVTAHRTPEPERLGRLQHPHVVPILSVHDASPHALICMPYLGRTTLADLLATERRHRLSLCSTRLALDGSKAGRAAQHPPPPAPVRGPADAPPVGRLDDVRWVLRLLADLAAGLDHAHGRGILHLDIKPENVLVADSGEPMLFDFNLAHDTTSRFREAVGGTLPYMAPEQIHELITREHGAVDARTDLFALGAVAYELLTCEPAFPTNWMSRGELPKYLAVRRVTVPSPRAKNPAVSPAVDAVVCKLLAPDPAARYRTAAELKADLDCQLADLPLRSAPDRSVPERVGKWRRRNPWVPLRLALAAVVGLALGSGFALRQRDDAMRVAHAVGRVEALRAALPTVRLDVTAPGDTAARSRGRARATNMLRQFGLPDDPNWRLRPAFARLPEAQRPAVAADLGEVLLLLAHDASLGRRTLPESERAAALGAAERLNRVAEGCFEPDSIPPFLYTQRTELAGRPEVAPAAEPKAARDHYLRALGLVGVGKFRDAVHPLRRAILADPTHAAAHYALAFCHHQSGEYARALERYETAQALLPGDIRPVFNRGLVYGLQQRHELAEIEFALALKIDPHHGDSYRNRAVARLYQKKPKLEEAEADLTAALDANASALQVYQLRAQVRERLGRHRDAEKDRAAAGEYEPRSEGDFLTRGHTRLPADPAGALADFEAAARFNPTSLGPLQNQAHVHAQYLHDVEKSLDVIGRAVELAPEYAPARAGRAILLARMGKREEAHKDAETVLALTADPALCYQLAGVYARTSTTHAADADRALDLLRQAVRDGFREHRTLDADPDLAPIRNRPEFTTLSDALRDLTR